MYKATIFIIIYLIFSLLIIPFLAPISGRKPLPVWGSSFVKPLTILTPLMNRHYVNEQLYDLIVNSSEEMADRYPGTITCYLDACFPFIDGFPMIPHLSHKDGKKLDLAFYYRDTETGEYKRGSPSMIGYGVCEGAKAGEEDYSRICSEKGNYSYSWLEAVVPQWSKDDYLFDGERTGHLIRILTKSPDCGKIFIEPHLKKRMGLDSIDKISFQGCRSVRHDDHIHVQVK